MCFGWASKFPVLDTNPCPLENEGTCAADTVSVVEDLKA